MLGLYYISFVVKPCTTKRSKLLNLLEPAKALNESTDAPCSYDYEFGGKS